MQLRRLTQIPGMTLAVMLTLIVAQGLVCGPEVHAEGGRGLISTTEVTVERSLIRGAKAETDEIIGVGTAKFFTPTGVLVGEGGNEDNGLRFAFED